MTKDYEQKEKQLRNRLVALYEAGPILYIDVLLSSKTLSDFISRYYKILEIMEYDNKLIETVEQEKKEIELSKQKLDKETEEYRTLKLKAEQSEVIYKNFARSLYDKVIKK